MNIAFPPVGKLLPGNNLHNVQRLGHKFFSDQASNRKLSITVFGNPLDNPQAALLTAKKPDTKVSLNWLNEEIDAAKCTSEALGTDFKPAQKFPLVSYSFGTHGCVSVYWLVIRKEAIVVQLPIRKEVKRNLLLTLSTQEQRVTIVRDLWQLSAIIEFATSAPS
ncbi:MAG: hypothetical protein VW333_08790 [Pseudomonadales bacterium]